MRSFPLGLKVGANGTSGLLEELSVGQAAALGDLGLRVFLGHLNVQVNSGLLSAEHGMGDVGGRITVGIANSPNTSLAGTHAASVNDNLLLGDIQAHLVGQLGVLNGGSIDDESTALDGVTLREVHKELVELKVGSLVLVGLTVLGALNAGDGTVVNLDVPCLELLLPACVLGLSSGLALGGIGSVHKCDDIRVEGVGLKNAAKDIGDAAKDSERLVTVF